MSATPTKTEAIAQFILGELKSGPVPSVELRNRVHDAFGIRSLYAAREALGSKVNTTVKHEGRVYWSLAAPAAKRTRKAA